jgi:hypothetical protein
VTKQAEAMGDLNSTQDKLSVFHEAMKIKAMTYTNIGKIHDWERKVA